MTLADQPQPSLPRDLDATLGVLTRLISEIQSTPTEQGRLQAVLEDVRSRPHLANLPSALLRIYNEINEAVNGIKLTRETIQTQALDHLRDSQARLTAVNSTTESAAMDLMDGLDRTLGLVDGIATASDGDRATALDALRNELNKLFGYLQFQDIIAQQVRGITTLIEEVEVRMGRVADLLDNTLSGPSESGPQDSRVLDHNPDASWRPAVDQASIDAAFAIKN
jgi:chemotaxis regulatin CheY-phosphate phosphatase CheZ